MVSRAIANPDPPEPGKSRPGGALQVYGRIDNPMSFSQEMGKTFAALTGCSVDQGPAVALTCMCEGLTPLNFVRKYHMIQGRPTMRADAMRAEFRMNHGGDFELVELSPDAVAIKVTDAKNRSRDFRLTWLESQQELWPWKSGKGPGAKDAKDREPVIANLKDNWSTPRGRQNMMLARITSEAMRAMCPELVAGVYTPEELSDAIDADYTVVSSAPAIAARKTASDMLAEQAAKQQQSAAGDQATGQVAAARATTDGGDEDALEAGFEIAPAADAASASDASDSAESATGTITEAQREEVRSLAEYLAIPHEQLQSILAKRNVQSFRSLSHEQAEEILSKFRAFARQKRAAEGSSGN